MRVLLVPEVYRPGDALACGTLNDAMAWVDEWLARDDRLHVYWLLPPQDEAGYDAADVHADRDRVTLVEADPLMAETERRDLFTEDGYAAAELEALREAIVDQGAYVDVVVDQRRTGRETLYRWLLEHRDQWAARVRPFDVVANVHDLQVPEKYRWASHRNDYQSIMEACGAAFADGIWFTAGVDARRFRSYAAEFLDSAVVDAAFDDAVEVGSPIDFERFDDEFADEPEWLHIAGSGWSKKNVDRVLAIADRLAETVGMRAVMTSPEAIPEKVRDLPWLDAYPNASRTEYEQGLARGDLAVCASDYETMARTPFEQAASGQVLVLRDRPWIYDCAPDDYQLTAPLEDLSGQVADAIAAWDDAVAETQHLLDHARAARDPAQVGKRTYRDLADRVREKQERYSSGGVVERALADVEEGVELSMVAELSADHTDDGRPVTARDDVARTDLRYRVRGQGYADRGGPGTPVFEPVDRWGAER